MQVEARVRAAMRSEVNDAQKLVRVELRDYVGRLAAEAGIVDPSGGRTAVPSDEDAQEVTGRNSAAARALAAKRSSEQELKSFQDK